MTAARMPALELKCQYSELFGRPDSRAMSATLVPSNPRTDIIRAAASRISSRDFAPCSKRLLGRLLLIGVVVGTPRSLERALRQGAGRRQ